MATERGAGTATLWIGGLLAAVAWLIAGLGVAVPYRPTVRVLPELLAVLALALGLRFPRSRLVVASLLVAITSLLLRGPLTTGTEQQVALGIALLGVLVPLDLALIGLASDQRLASWKALGQLVFLAMQLPLGVALVAIAGRGSGAAAQALSLLRVRQTAWAVLLVAGLVVGLGYLVRRTSFDAALLWVLALASRAISAQEATAAPAVLLTAAQLVLLVAFVEDAYRLAYHDELTGLPGKRALNEGLRRLREKYTVAMIDIDRFKRFNDRHGHDAGDQVLRMVAQEIARVGAGGRAYRYGGEEFAVLFPGTAPEAALTALDIVRETIARRLFVLRGPDRPKNKPDRPLRGRPQGPKVAITVSIGLAGPSAKRTTPREVLKAADRALYRAKRDGRNRVVATLR
ncbi:MAG: GGDEF domain-containing protein [Acidobacteria bacterium]|jgi:GGDEF domain-containing protein|nr:GGDEF domain-containing protein [Acidobacteriota bacterium]